MDRKPNSLQGQGLTKRFDTGLLRVILAVGVLAFLWASGCSEDEGESLPAFDAEQVRSVVDAFDGANLWTLDLEAILTAGPAAIAVLAERLGQGGAPTRWAALVGLAALGHQRNAAGAVLPHLKSALNDPDISVKVTAAELVTSFGDKGGIPVLIDAVDSDIGNLRPAEPPTSVCTQVLRVLGHYTGYTFTEEADWRAWWDANQDRLEWDPDHERFW